MRRSLLALTGLALALLIGPPDASAQGRVGLGAQVGDVTGFSLKLGPTGRAYDFAAAWDFDDDFLLVQGHLLLDQPVLSRSPNGRIQWFYGPGAFVGFDEDGRGRGDDDDVIAGLSFNIGLAWFPTPAFELFGQLTPRLLLAPSSDFDLGAAIGLRFYP